MIKTEGLPLVASVGAGQRQQVIHKRRRAGFLISIA